MRDSTTVAAEHLNEIQSERYLFYIVVKSELLG